MRILYFANSQVWGGGEQTVLLAARIMAARGHHVGVAAHIGSPLAQRVADFKGDVELVEVSIGPKLGRRSIVEFLWNANRYRSDICKLVLRHADRHWDVVNFQYKKEQLLGTVALERLGYVVSWTEHGGLPSALAAIPIARAWYRNAAASAAGIAAVSRFVASSLTAAGVSHPRMHVIYNAVDERIFVLDSDRRAKHRTDLLLGVGWPTSAVVIGTVSRLTSRKGVAGLIVAALNVMQSRENACLLIVGDGGERHALEKLIPESFRARVAFVGFQRDVPRFLAAIDVFVSPTTDPNEGLPMCVVEAMMSGAPVVVTRVGGQPEAVADGRTGIVVSPDDLWGLARAIDRLVSQQSERCEMGARASRAAITQFGIQGFAAAHEAFLTQCCESRSSRPYLGADSLGGVR